MQTEIEDESPLVGRPARRDGIVLGLLRILVGLLWLANLEWKRPIDFGETSGTGLFGYVSAAVEHPSVGWWGWSMRELVVPNFRPFGWLLLIVEVGLAALLLIGYRTRIVALIGAGLSLGILLTLVNSTVPGASPWLAMLMVGAHLALFATSAGMYLGLDGVFEAGVDELARVVLAGAAIVVGVVGFFVARSVDFAAAQGASVGSDEWDLRLVWFNRLSASITIVGGIAVLVGWRIGRREATEGAAAGFAVVALVQLVQTRFNSGNTPFPFEGGVFGGNATTVAVWTMFAIGFGLIAWRARRAELLANPRRPGEFPTLDG